MLVLTRRTDESLVIGENIIVTILAIEGEKVKIGISAPRTVTILRKELWQAIQEQNQIAEKIAEESEPDHFEELRKFLAQETDAEENPVPIPDTGTKSE